MVPEPLITSRVRCCGTRWGALASAPMRLGGESRPRSAIDSPDTDRSLRVSAWPGRLIDLRCESWPGRQRSARQLHVVRNTPNLTSDDSDLSR